MDREQDVFEHLYPKFKTLFDLSIQEGYTAMEVFGIMLGIIAQQYRNYSTKEEFENFLLTVASQGWPEPDPPKKQKPNLKIVH